VLGGEVEEGEQRLAILDQAGDGPIVLRRVLGREGGERRLGRRSVGRQPDLPQVLPSIGLQRLRQLVQNIDRLVDPTALVPGGREHLLQRFPEAERTVTDRQLGCDGQAAGLEPDQQFPPALCALTGADLKADQLLLALWRGTDDHQHAFGLGLHSGLQVDAVGPDVDVAPGRQVALLPALVLALPVAP
jgi:hypothetical protein